MKKKNGAMGAILTGVSAVALAVAVVAVAGGVVSGSAAAYPNVTLKLSDPAREVAVGGKTQDEIVSELDSLGLTVKTVSVKLTDDTTVSVTTGSQDSVSKLAESAVSYGKDGNVFTNFFTYVRCMVGGSVIEAKGTGTDESAIRSVVHEAVQKVSYPAEDDEVTIGEDSITIVRGKAGYEPNENEIVAYIISALANGSETTDRFSEDNLKVQEKRANINQLYEQIYREPQDAYYDAANDRIVEPVTGRAFDLEKAREAYGMLTPGRRLILEYSI
ncbi:MAG: peptidoglycan binding domain-containing protein, partial [Oscillospiraceae bacterium]|nr:peptidoglycan binding domain-containing protein [Oscillospiraceae bacterium]